MIIMMMMMMMMIVHLVGFIIRIYHDARSPERQKRYQVNG